MKTSHLPCFAVLLQFMGMNMGGHFDLPKIFFIFSATERFLQQSFAKYYI